MPVSANIRAINSILCIADSVAAEIAPEVT